MTAGSANPPPGCRAATTFVATSFAARQPTPWHRRSTATDCTLSTPKCRTRRRARPSAGPDHSPSTTTSRPSDTGRSVSRILRRSPGGAGSPHAPELAALAARSTPTGWIAGTSLSTQILRRYPRHWLYSSMGHKPLRQFSACALGTFQRKRQTVDSVVQRQTARRERFAVGPCWAGCEMQRSETQ